MHHPSGGPKIVASSTAGGAYNVDTVLKVMVRGLEQELSARNMDGWQTADACHEGQLTIRVLYSDH
jgi:hypothetical protein